MENFDITFTKIIKALSAPWNPTNLNQYKITLSKNGNSMSFKYWEGCVEGIELPLHLETAIYKFFLDIKCGSQSFNYFCECYGYNNDSIKDRNVWLSMRRMYKKFRNTFYYTIEDIDEMIEIIENNGGSYGE